MSNDDTSDQPAGKPPTGRPTRRARPRRNPAAANKPSRLPSLSAAFDLPIHGPEGRIAALLHGLAMKQTEFAEAVGTSRETVSHWINLDDEGNPRQRTTRSSAAALAHVAREEAGWAVEGSFFHQDGETAYAQFLHELKKLGSTLDSQLTEIRERLPSYNHAAAGFAGGGCVAERFVVGDIVGWRSHPSKPDEHGVVLEVEDVAALWLDFYCDPCDARWSIPDPNGYWRARIADEGDFPHCPSQESPDCEPRWITSYSVAVRASQNVTVDFGRRIGAPAEFSADHLRLIVRRT